MDADCLIKLTKAGLKEFICKQEKIVIPGTVKREVVDAGKSKGHPDAELIEENIRAWVNHAGQRSCIGSCERRPGPCGHV